jgi:hypothetical protein
MRVFYLMLCLLSLTAFAVVMFGLLHDKGVFRDMNMPKYYSYGLLPYAIVFAVIVANRRNVTIMTVSILCATIVFVFSATNVSYAEYTWRVDQQQDIAMYSTLALLLVILLKKWVLPPS